jgi:hypothetical protein
MKGWNLSSPSHISNMLIDLAATARLDRKTGMN